MIVIFGQQCLWNEPPPLDLSFGGEEMLSHGAELQRQEILYSDSTMNTPITQLAAGEREQDTLQAIPNHPL